MHSHTRLRFGATTAVTASFALVLALSACSTPPTPNPEPTASGSNSTSGGPTSVPPPATSAVPTASTPPAPDTAYQPATPTSPAKNVPKPVMPALAKENSESGQKAFIKYWLETYNYAFDSGDPEPLRSASTPDCGFCKGAASGAVTMHETRQSWRLGGGTTSDLRIFKALPAENRLIRIQVQVSDAAVSFFDKMGKSNHYKSHAASISLHEFWLERSGAGWRLVELD